jgi:hypothetical protein
VPGAPPDKTIREVETPVTLPDGHTAILGGLVNNVDSDTLSKVPWLGDLPLIGWLFRLHQRPVARALPVRVHHAAHHRHRLRAAGRAVRGAQADVERLGGDVSDLSAGMASVDPADRRAIGPGLDAVFEMPSAAMPRAGETHARQPAGSGPHAPAPSSQARLDQVFGYPKEDKPGN